MSKRTALSLLAAMLTVAGAASAATPDATVTARLTAVREAFTRRAAEEGYRVCPAPGIKLAELEPYGRFDPDSNTMLVATWSRLTPPQQQRFENLVGHTQGQRSAEEMFEDGIYGWVFVHELAHWWQECRQASRPHSYGAEDGANRIALAFWRERDPQLALRMLDTFGYLRGSIASPVPQGMAKQEYLDAHFLAIVQSRGYTWYQADMTLELATETPRPSFHKALSQPLFPW